MSRSTSQEADSGARRSRRGGDGTDFLDYRSYAPGDDVRKIDWSVYARTRQIFVRLNESPRQSSVTLLIDTSRSMGFGSRCSKLEQAQRLACALAFVSMRNGDRVFVESFAQPDSDTSTKSGVGPLIGSRGLASVVRFLQSLEAAGESALRDAVRRIRGTRPDRGLIVVISDFLNVPERDEQLRLLGSAGGIVLALQVLDPIDRGEGLSGKIRLRDSETGRLVDVDLDHLTLKRFKALFERDRTDFERSNGGPKRRYLLAETTDNYLEIISSALQSNLGLR